MRTCIKCGKDFDDSLMTKCSWCGYLNPKEVPKEKTIKDNNTIVFENDSPSADDTLNGIANFILIALIIISIISFFFLGFSPEFNFMGIIISLSILLSGIVVWAIMKVIRNISINTRNAANCLKKIAEKE